LPRVLPTRLEVQLLCPKHATIPSKHMAGQVKAPHWQSWTFGGKLRDVSPSRCMPPLGTEQPPSKVVAAAAAAARAGGPLPPAGPQPYGNAMPRSAAARVPRAAAGPTLGPVLFADAIPSGLSAQGRFVAPAPRSKTPRSKTPRSKTPRSKTPRSRQPRDPFGRTPVTLPATSPLGAGNPAVDGAGEAQPRVLRVGEPLPPTRAEIPAVGGAGLGHSVPLHVFAKFTGRPASSPGSPRPTGGGVASSFERAASPSRGAAAASAWEGSFGSGALVLPGAASAFVGVPGDELAGGTPAEQLARRRRPMSHWTAHMDGCPALRLVLSPQTSSYLTLARKSYQT